MGRIIRVLTVEDNPADADLTREVLEMSKNKFQLFVAIDGLQALEFLQRRSDYEAAPRPDIILLDLNMPGLDGRATLKRIKADESISHIPVIIMTSSDAESDIASSYNLGASCYVTKPIELLAYQEMIKSLEEFWFNVVKLPANELAEKQQSRDSSLT